MSLPITPKNSRFTLLSWRTKALKSTANALSSDIVNAFKGVEGRLKEVRFVVSAQNNYELIQHVIKKKVSDCKPWFQEQNNKKK